MPSNSFQDWSTVRSAELDELASAHAAVGGTLRGRRFATQQINRSYAILLASQFQGFCRNLHTECVDHVLTVLAPSAAMHPVIQAEFTRQRQLDRANANPGSIGSDFGRLGIDFWREAEAYSPAASTGKAHLVLLNEWRNAIAHQDFHAGRLGGATVLHIRQVRIWRRSCDRLAVIFDAILHEHLEHLTGIPPW